MASAAVGWRCKQCEALNGIAIGRCKQCMALRDNQSLPPAERSALATWNAANGRSHWASPDSSRWPGVVVGLLVAGVAGLISVATYESAASNNGGSYFVFYLAILWGLWKAARSALAR